MADADAAAHDRERVPMAHGSVRSEPWRAVHGWVKHSAWGNWCWPVSAARSTACSASVAAGDPDLSSWPAPGSYVDADGDDDDDVDDYHLSGLGSSNAAPDSLCRNGHRVRSCEPDSAIWPDSSRRSMDLMNTLVKVSWSALYAWHNRCGGAFLTHDARVAREVNHKHVIRLLRSRYWGPDNFQYYWSLNFLISNSLIIEQS